MPTKQPFVYILASDENGTLYIGVTSNLIQRIWEHKTGITKGFVGKYEVFKLVYLEPHDTMDLAIVREKQMKKWNRVWKLRLIEKANPTWKDLWGQITQHY